MKSGGVVQRKSIFWVFSDERQFVDGTRFVLRPGTTIISVVFSGPETGGSVRPPSVETGRKER